MKTRRPQAHQQRLGAGFVATIILVACSRFGAGGLSTDAVDAADNDGGSTDGSNHGDASDDAVAEEPDGSNLGVGCGTPQPHEVFCDDFDEGHETTLWSKAFGSFFVDDAGFFSPPNAFAVNSPASNPQVAFLRKSVNANVASVSDLRISFRLDFSSTNPSALNVDIAALDFHGPGLISYTLSFTSNGGAWKIEEFLDPGGDGSATRTRQEDVTRPINKWSLVEIEYNRTDGTLRATVDSAFAGQLALLPPTALTTVDAEVGLTFASPPSTYRVRYDDVRIFVSP